MRPRISDDRARRVRLVQPAHAAAAPPAARRALHRAYFCSARGIAILTLAAVVGSGLSTGFVSVAGRSDWWSYPAFMLVSGGVGVAALVIGLTLGVFAREPFNAAARSAMLRAGLCPSCGYALGGVAPEPDGCRACPECGAAWRTDPPPREAGGA